MTAAAFEWVWEMGAIACAAMVLGAVIVVGREEAVGDDALDAAAPRRVLPRVAVALLAAVALAAVAVPMAGALATRESRDAAADGRLGAALQDSRTAQRLQPYAATPDLQRALVLEEAGALPGAAGAARAATVDEPTNWRTWFVLARIDARRGQAADAVKALRVARRLNPRSALLGAG
jgi:cytochrome c-type biogenesis protein CcmH/NrfG